MSHNAPPTTEPVAIGIDAAPIDYIEIENSPEFLNLRRRHTNFVFPLAVFFLIWYFAYVIFAAFRPDLMAIPVFGVINLGLLLGLGQFVTTFAITMGYVSYSNRHLDPLATEIRESLEARESAAKEQAR